MTENHQVQPLNRLYRWLHPGQFDWQEKRPTSAAFKDPYMSVDLADLTTLDESYRRGRLLHKNAVASITAKCVLEKEQRICHCPTQTCKSSGEHGCSIDPQCPAYQEDWGTREVECINPAHACVIGNKSKSVAKFFAKSAQVEIYPPNEPTES
jgi:hypothetical protein